MLRPSPGKALWRDAEALVRGLVDKSHANVVRDAMLAHEHRGGPTTPWIRAVGQIVSQGKVVDVRDARFPISAALLEEETGVALVGALVDAAEIGAAALRAGVHAFATASGSSDGWKLAGRAEASYWAARAPAFRSRLFALAAASGDGPVAELIDSVIVPWRFEVVHAARDAFGDYARRGLHDPRAMRALVAGQNALERRLARLSPDTQEST